MNVLIGYSHTNRSREKSDIGRAPIRVSLPYIHIGCEERKVELVRLGEEDTS